MGDDHPDGSCPGRGSRSGKALNIGL
jgi:hypothetical protein